MKYIQASTRMRISDIVDRKDKLKHLFLEVIEQGIKYFNLENGLLESFQQLFEKFDLKYPQFSNLRDISLLPNKFSDTIKIKEGLIYRTASLSENDKELIMKFLNHKDIKFIFGAEMRSHIDKVKVVADNSITVYLKKPYPAFLVRCAEYIPIVPLSGAKKNAP